MMHIIQNFLSGQEFKVEVLGEQARFCWLPDGKIVYISLVPFNDTQGTQVGIIDLANQNPVEFVIPNFSPVSNVTCSPIENKIVVSGIDLKERTLKLVAVNLDAGIANPETITETDIDAAFINFNADGKKLTMIGRTSFYRPYGLFMYSFEAQEITEIDANADLFPPVWKGNEIIYIRLNADHLEFMSVDADTLEEKIIPVPIEKEFNPYSFSVFDDLIYFFYEQAGAPPSFFLSRFNLADKSSVITPLLESDSSSLEFAVQP